MYVGERLFRDSKKRVLEVLDLVLTRLGLIEVDYRCYEYYEDELLGISETTR